MMGENDQLPDDPGKIPDDAARRLAAWFDSKHILLVCPICRANSWGTFGHIVAPNVYSSTGMVVGGISYPLMNVVCQNCGSVQSFSAVMLGLAT